jgi:hypothetical protein
MFHSSFSPTSLKIPLTFGKNENDNNADDQIQHFIEIVWTQLK